MFNLNLKARWDYENSIAFAVEKTEERAEHRKSLDIAPKFKKMGVPLSDIAEGTGLSIDEVEKL